MLCSIVACKDEKSDRTREIESQFSECYARMYEAVANDNYEGFKEANDEVRTLMVDMSEGEKSTARKAIDKWKEDNRSIVDANMERYEAMRERYNSGE